MALAYYPNTSGALVLFDLTNHKSFEGARFWLEDSRHYFNYLKSVVQLIGCKSNLENMLQVQAQKDVLAFTKTLNLNADFKSSDAADRDVQETMKELPKNCLPLGRRQRRFTGAPQYAPGTEPPKARPSRPDNFVLCKHPCPFCFPGTYHWDSSFRGSNESIAENIHNLHNGHNEEKPNCASEQKFSTLFPCALYR